MSMTASDRLRYEEHKELHGVTSRTLRLRALRRQVLDFYGGQCRCGVTEPCFLTVDHVHDDGAEHRKTLPGQRLIEWLVKTNFPDGFQLLCWNCNWRKHLARLRLDLSDTKKQRNRRQSRKNAKLQAFAAYGGASCQCCGEADEDVLTIDHINNDGSAHLKEIVTKQTSESWTLYKWLRDQGYPAGFRVLCFNCNSGRQANGGACPHQR